MTTPIVVSDQDLPLQCLYRWEKNSPNSIYLTQPMGGGVVQDITWAQAADQIRRAAAWLQAQGWPEGSRVGVMGKNSAHWLLADLAILMAGYVSVPIYPTFNPEALAYILAHSDTKALFVGKLDDPKNVRDGAPAGMPIITLPLAPAIPGLRWDDLIAQTQPLQGMPTVPMDAVQTIIYTSGTTGQPKGVVHTCEAMAWAVSSGTRRLSMTAQERYISYLPLAHVAERMVIEQAVLRFGGHVFFAESLDTFQKDLQRARPTIFFSVPRLWVKFQHGVHSKMPAKRLKLLMALPFLGGVVRRKILAGLGLDACRLALGGAAPMPADVLQWYRKLGLDLVEVYGMTENCGASHATLPGSQDVGTVGLPYDGVECRIDPVTGEIQMRCKAVMQGYYREPELTAQAFTSDGWLRTGDKGIIDATGQLRITGRVKDIFKTSKGKYVAPARLEDLLVQNPDVEACAVTGSGNLPQPLALVMLSPDAVKRSADAQQKNALTESMVAHLAAVNEQLEPHEKIALLIVVTTAWTPENGFVTPTMKIKRDRIEAAYGTHFAPLMATGQRVVWFSDLVPAGAVTPAQGELRKPAPVAADKAVDTVA